VVYESRFYTSFLPNPTSAGEVNLKNGMFLIRRSLNRVHKLLSQDGFSEVNITRSFSSVSWFSSHRVVVLISIISMFAFRRLLTSWTGMLCQ